MFKKLILILALICMIVLPAFGQTGSYTTHELFYLPQYGAYGLTEYNTYNEYMEIADLQIWANKLAIDAIEIRTDEQIEDVVGAMTTGNTETFISVDYQDDTADIDFVVPVKDEDNMVSNSDTFLATQQSIKAYADTKQTHWVYLDQIGNTSPMSGDIIIGKSLDGSWQQVDGVFDDWDTHRLKHESGGLEADVSAYDGLVKITGGVTSAVADNSTNWNTAYGWGDWSGALAALKFTDLADTPANYTGQAGKYVKVNAGATALEFGTPTGGAGTYLELTDTPAAYDNGKYAKSTAAGVVWDTPAGTGTVTTSGTPVANDIARFTGATVIEGLTYDELTTALALNSDDLSDRATIAMLDENEIITGIWGFGNYFYIQRFSDTAGPYMAFDRKRDGDPTWDVSSGDGLGRLYFSGRYGANFFGGAEIEAHVDGTPGNNDMPGRLEFRTTPDDTFATVLRMAIDNAGNIKMGDGAWTNYINVSNLGVLTLEGTANIEGVDATELSYLDGVTSDIQTQLDAKKGKNYYSALGSDHTYSDNADTDSQPVGESVVFGDLLYFNWAKVTGTDIAFVDGGAGEDTITQVAAKFLEIGLVAGDVITVSGSTSNNGNYTIISVVAGTINVATGSLIAEAAGASVTITSPYEWKKTDADFSYRVPGLRIALETKTNGQTCLMLVKGYIRDDSAFEFIGSMVYASVTPGAMSSTAPTETGDQIQRVGVAKSADILFFNPSIDVGEI